MKDGSPSTSHSSDLKYSPMNNFDFPSAVYQK